jgi:hypothetical protein
MTLVVARVTPLGVRLSGDMRVTDPKAAGPRGHLGAALKMILLRPTLCIAYAGNVGAALEAIREVHSRDLNTDDAESYLLDAHHRSAESADFLIASLRPSRLVAVKNGRSESLSAAWIGEPEAFAEYQRYYHQEVFRPPDDFYDSAERAGDIEIATRMGNGMAAVVYGPGLVIDGETRTVNIPQGGSHKTVGEEIVHVVPRAEDNLFRYSHQMRYTASPFDADAQGAFSYSMLAADDPGVGVIGVYIDQAELGLLHAPLLLDEPDRPEPYGRVSRQEFAELVLRRHGIQLRGLGN